MDGVEWNGYVAGGGGPALLLLPGYLVGPEDWFRVILRLASDFRIVAPALPPVSRVESIVAGLAAILDGEGVDAAHVVGQSLGGLYGERFARSHPRRARSLVLCHGSAPQTAMVGRIRRGVRLGALLPTWMHRVQWRRRIAAERGDRWPDAAFWRGFLTEKVAATTKAELIGWGRCYLDLLVTAAAEDATALAPPVLLVDAEDDPVISGTARTELVARHPRARRHTFADTGHWTPELDPDALCEVLRRFLDEVESSPPALAS